MRYTFPSSWVAAVFIASLKFEPTFDQTSSMGVNSPWLAKNRIRCPENHVITSSGAPCRYWLRLSWNEPWSTVLSLTWIPVSWVKASTTACMAFLGVGSELFEPMFSVPVAPLPAGADEAPGAVAEVVGALDPGEPLAVPAGEHAASSPGSPAIPTTPAAPRMNARRAIGRCGHPLRSTSWSDISDSSAE